MYGPALVRHTLPSGQPVTMTITTDYPFSDSVVVGVETEGSLHVSLRVPSWASGATVQTNSDPPHPARPGMAHKNDPGLCSNTGCVCVQEHFMK